MEKSPLFCYNKTRRDVREDGKGMKGELLKRLRNQKEYLSGEELSEALQVSRTAIWKGIQTLRKQGYQIQALPRKGYRLLEEPPSFSKEEIESWLDTSYFGREILFF